MAHWEHLLLPSTPWDEAFFTVSSHFFGTPFQTNPSRFLDSILTSFTDASFIHEVSGYNDLTSRPKPGIMVKEHHPQTAQHFRFSEIA